MRSSFFLALVVTFAFTGDTFAKSFVRSNNEVAEAITNIRYGDETARFLRESTEENGELPDAADEERGWQEVLEKLKGTNIMKNAEEFKGKDSAKWESVAAKAEAGGELKTENAAKVRWQNALAKLKEEGKLNTVTEAKVEKITEEAAKEIVKTPKKWPYIKKALKIALGAGLTALIVVGIEGMIGSTT
uniref:PaRXLR1 n=1 Tax=Phytophthora agathidicida TaxID=1642459 RepID=A0A7G4WHZ0_9STRA|nr:PaRXLR1 [Phytophthora agathidicida]